jgi:hypothetical protein
MFRTTQEELILLDVQLSHPYETNEESLAVCSECKSIELADELVDGVCLSCAHTIAYLNV